MVKKKKLFSVTGLYKNDLPGGVGIGFDLSHPQLRLEFHKTCASYQRVWDSSSEQERVKWVETYFHQIREYGAMDPKSREAGWDWLIVINIWFLERHGFIHPDEFNGCVLTYFQ